MQSKVTEPNSKAAWEAFIGDLRMIFMIIIGAQDDVNLSNEDRVPRFLANSASGDQVTADLIVLGIGVYFGVIHCIAWHFSFLTHIKLLMWQISSVAITAVPIYVPLVFSLGTWLGNMDFEIFGITFLVFGPLCGGIVYIIVQVVTLVLAFTSLRDLPPGVYETVHWTTFILMYSLYLHICHIIVFSFTNWPSTLAPPQPNLSTYPQLLHPPLPMLPSTAVPGTHI